MKPGTKGVITSRGKELDRLYEEHGAKPGMVALGGWMSVRYCQGLCLRWLAVLADEWDNIGPKGTFASGPSLFEAEELHV